MTREWMIEVSPAHRQVFEDRALHHLAHLVGHARDGVDHLGLAVDRDRTDQSRRGARHLGDGRRAHRHVGLA
jgi:hypothetical protein